MAHGYPPSGGQASPRPTSTSGCPSTTTDEDRTWVFDVTFLTSNWTCIYGNGCPGILDDPAPELEQGCCSYGAHFTRRRRPGQRRGEGRAARPRTSGSSRRRARSAVRSTSTTTARRSAASSTAAASSSTAPASPAAPAAPCTAAALRRGRVHHRLEAGGVLAGPAPSHRRHRRLRPRHRRRSGSGSAATGARAARSSTGGAPTATGGLRRPRAGVEACEEELVAMTTPAAYAASASYLAARADAGESPAPPSSAQDERRRRPTYGNPYRSTGRQSSNGIRSPQPSWPAPPRRRASSIPEHVLDQLVAAVEAGKHVVLTGPPGTGKTTLAYLAAEVGQRALLCTGFLPDHGHVASGRPSRPSAASSPPPTASSSGPACSSRRSRPAAGW